MAETTTPISQPNDREVVITRVACRTVVMTEQVTPESPVLSLEDHVTGQLRRLCAVFGLGVVTDEYTCLLGELLGPVANKSLADRDAPTSGSLPKDDDRQLMARVAAQDRRAITLLYQRYAPRLGRFLSKLLKNHTLVDEVVNDTMLVVWRKAAQFGPERAPLSTWLFGIAHHLGLKALARSAKDSGTALPIGEGRDHEEPDSTHDPETTVLGWELGRALTAALEQLSPEHRAVIELAFVEGFSYPEIARIVGCPENTVKTRMFHARRRLAQLLSHLEWNPAVLSC